MSSAVTRVLHNLRATRLASGEPTTDDGQLLGDFITHHDAAAFEALVRRHGPMVLGVCRRMLHHEQDAADAFQAVFLVLVRKASSLRAPDRVGNWLYGVAYRTARKARVLLARRRRYEKQVLQMPERIAGPDDSGHPMLVFLDEEIHRLPAKYREPLILCELQCRSRKEVAQQLRLPEGTLSSRLATARQMLACRLTRRVAGGTAGTMLAALLADAASAGVPTALLGSTVQAGMLVAGGQACAGVVSAAVCSLTEGALQSMFLSRISISAVAIVLTVTLALGIRAGATHVSADMVRADTPVVWVRSERHAQRPVALVARPKPPPPAPTGVVGVESNQIVTVAWAHNGQWIAGGGMDKAVRLWNAKTGKVAHLLTNSKGIVRAVAFSPDSKLVAAGGDDGMVRFWDMKTGALKHSIRISAGMVLALALSSDGKLLATASERFAGPNRSGMVQVWELPSGNLLWKQPCQTRGLAFSPRGDTLAAGVGEVRLWAARTGKLKHTWKSKQGHIDRVVFSPDGRLLAGTDGHAKVFPGGGTQWIGEVVVWDVRSGKIERTINELNPWLRCVAFSPDGHLLAAGTSGPIRQFGPETRVTSELTFWDLRTGTRAGRVEGPLGDVWSIAFAPDGKSVVACDEESARVINVQSGAVERLLMTRTLGPMKQP